MINVIMCINACLCVGCVSFQGNNIHDEAARTIQEGLNECARWGELDTQALLMVEGAELELHRGKPDNSLAMLQVQHTDIFY